MALDDFKAELANVKPIKQTSGYTLPDKQIMIDHLLDMKEVGQV